MSSASSADFDMFWNEAEEFGYQFGKDRTEVPKLLAQTSVTWDSIAHTKNQEECSRTA